MKKVKLLETYLKEKDENDPDFRGKVNKELTGFKSLLHNKSENHKTNSTDLDKVNKELDKANWELSENKEGFDLDLEDSFTNSYSEYEEKTKSNKFGTKPEDAFSDAYNNSIKETIIGIDKSEPLDELEHVSLIIHPDVESEQDIGSVDGCDSKNTKVSTFSAPGGPNFKNSEKDNKDVLFDSDEINKESNLDKENDSEENEEWLQYLLEPEKEKHNLHSNDMKNKNVLNKEYKHSIKENVSKLKNKLSKINKSMSESKQISENFKILKTKINKFLKENSELPPNLDPNKPIRFSIYPHMLEQHYQHHFRNDNSKIYNAKKAAMNVLNKQFGIQEDRQNRPSGFVFIAPNVQDFKNFKNYLNKVHDQIVPENDPNYDANIFISILASAWPDGIKEIEQI